MSSGDIENSNSNINLDVMAPIKGDISHEDELLKKGNSIGVVSLEWSLEYLTRNRDFLKERSMSPLSMYAVHVWTGSQKCNFESQLSSHGKIRNELFKLIIHPVHELVNCFKNNEYYLVALNSKKPIIFDSNNVPTSGIKISLISDNSFDVDFILKQVKWLYKSILKTEESINEINNNIREENEDLFKDIVFSDDIKSKCMIFCSKIIFYWLIHNTLNNFLYNPNGPISNLGFNILMEKFSPFFLNHNEDSKILYSDIISFSESMTEIWKSIKSKNNLNDSISNCLDRLPNDGEDFMKCLTEIASKYSLDDILNLLSDLIISINNILPISSEYKCKLNIDNYSNTQIDVNHTKLFPLYIDPKEPFNSIFDITGFTKAMSACREFPELLKPKTNYNKISVNKTRLILNHCLRNNLCNPDYISINHSENQISNNDNYIHHLNNSENNIIDHSNQKNHNTRQSSSKKNHLINNNNNDSNFDNDIEIHSIKRKSIEFTHEYDHNNHHDQSDSSKKIHLYSDDKVKIGRKVSLKGISETSDSGSDLTPKIRTSKRINTNSQSSSISPTSNSSRKYRRWSQDETNLLIQGVNEYGLGKWRAILATTKLTRDEVGLKDRWRNLIKGGHVMWDSKTRKYYLVK